VCIGVDSDLIKKPFDYLIIYAKQYREYKMSIQTYVYNGEEVVLTGRTAEKTLRSGRSKVLHEIRPLSVTDPENRQYNKWVIKDKDLLMVNE
jgi:hypothetical protein